jgi:6-pyruvoyltetrahydropterin/6-carboxytetrahydropterin synthase
MKNGLEYIDTLMKCCYFQKSPFLLITNFLPETAMYHVTIQTYFSAAHSLRNYKGRCENLHGHNWKIEVTASSDQLDEAGMALDFSILKKKTKALLEKLDHRNLNDIAPFSEINPSSENIAFYLFKLLTEDLEDSPVTLTQVTVWESDTSRASYTRTQT